MQVYRKSLLIVLMIITLHFVALSQTIDRYLPKLSPTLIELVKAKSGLIKTSAKPYSVQSAAVNARGEAVYGIIIKTIDADELKSLKININSKFKGFVTARATVDEIIKIIGLNSVSFVETGEVLYPTNDIANAAIGADLLHSGYFNSTVYKGSGVILCIIDSGIDWSHPDFRGASDQTQSRIQYIWDQTLTASGSEKTPEGRDAVNLAGLNYGVEYSKTDIENEIDGTPAGFVREGDTNGHGTHVTGTAAGNGAALTTLKYAGIAPEADIVVVKAGNGSFPNSNVIDGLTYAQKIATQLGKPVVVNMSLGGQSNPHDGTSALDQATDSFVGAGRVAVVAAGNDGSNSIHITGSIANGGTANINFTVPSYTATGGANNDYFGFDLWFDTGGSLSATATTPNSQTATQGAGTDGTTETTDGSIYLYNYINATNNDREVYLYVDDNNASITPAAGTWTLSVTNNSGSAMTYHGWLFGSSMGATLTGGNSNYTVASPGTATSAITAGSYVTKWSWHATDGGNYSYSGTNYSDDISSFSSIGPRRDGVQKPDIAAPGQAIISALSSSSSPSASTVVVTSKYLVEQGTSMASPVTAGAAALLLQQNSSLTYAQVKSLITENANTDTYTGAVPDYYWGYGKLNIFKSMVKAVNSSTAVQSEISTYDQWGSFGAVSIGPSVKLAVRFTPSFSGTVTGLFFHLYLNTTITSPVYAEIWSNGGGLPNAKLGSTVSLAADALAGHSWNFIDMQGTGVNVTSGTDYHAVIYWTSDSGSNSAIEYDNGSVDNRSSVYTGIWSAYGNDFRIRPVIVTSAVALPVELTNFWAEGNNGKIILHWKTANEINNYGFDIERASSLKNGTTPVQGWAKIGFIQGNGNSNSPREYSFIDEFPSGGNKLMYRLKQIDFSGAFTYSPEVDVELNVPSYALEQNYPNPFNPVTTIKFQVPVKTKVKVFVFDILGRKVDELVDDIKETGIHKIDFDGSRLSSGVYFVKMEATGFSDVKKITLLK